MARAMARPIKTARDYKAAASIASKARRQEEREPEAERRLQALINALDKYDDAEGDDGDGDAAEELDSSLRRRWSDDA